MEVIDLGVLATISVLPQRAITVVGILALHFKTNVLHLQSNLGTCTEDLHEPYHFSFLPFWPYEITKLARDVDFFLKHKVLSEIKTSCLD